MSSFDKDTCTLTVTKEEIQNNVAVYDLNKAISIENITTYQNDKRYRVEEYEYTFHAKRIVIETVEGKRITVSGNLPIPCRMGWMNWRAENE